MILILPFSIDLILPNVIPPELIRPQLSNPIDDIGKEIRFRNLCPGKHPEYLDIFNRRQSFRSHGFQQRLWSRDQAWEIAQGRRRNELGVSLDGRFADDSG